MRSSIIFKRLLWWIAVLTALQFATLQAASAASTGAIAQTYDANSSNVTQGALLSLTATNSTTVELANSTTNVSTLVGVAADNPLVEFSGNTSGKVHVVVGGSTSALVSNINGPVSVGDKLTASPVSGIGMKATQATEVVGVAQADLSSVRTVTKTVTERSGKSSTIKVGLLPIAVNVAYYSTVSLSDPGAVSSLVPPFLQSLANAITGKPVSALRVVLGMLALVLGFALAGIMFYTATRNSITSVGRNPLAQQAIHRGFIDIILTALGVLVITFAVIYAILLV